MIPKKANSLYKKITSEFEVSEDLVNKLVENYYKTLRKKLSGLDDLRINVEGLGHFFIKIQKIKTAIPHYEKILKNNNNVTFSDYYNKKNETVEEIARLRYSICDECEHMDKRKRMCYERYSTLLCRMWMFT
jgi:nucleoid DNA-binding protein